MKVKLIAAPLSTSFVDEVNDFIKDKQVYDIKYVSYDMPNYKHREALVIYEEENQIDVR